MKQIISTHLAPKAIGPYSQAIIAPKLELVFLSGQIPLDPKTMELVGDDVLAQTEQVLLNMKAVLEASGCGFQDVVKTTIFLKSMDDFATVNEVYARFFTENQPARSTVEVARLPKNVKVEIEAIAVR